MITFGANIFTMVIQEADILLSERKKEKLELDRDFKRSKKMKDKKIDKKLLEAFSKLNNRNYYAYFTDEDSMSYHNLMEFLILVEKALESHYGKASSYKKSQVYDTLHQIITDPTERQVKTLNAINKVMKKNAALFDDIKFNGLCKGTWGDEFYTDDQDAIFVTSSPDEIYERNPKKKKKKKDKSGPKMSSYDDIYDAYENL
jgi:hypothetical protein